MSIGSPSWFSTVLQVTGRGPDGTTTVNDESPNAAGKLTMVGGAQISGGGLAFNGTDAAMLGASGTPFDLSGDFSVEARFVFNAHTATQDLIGNYHNSTTGWQLQWRSDTSSLRFSHGDTSLIERAWSPTDGTEYHIAVARSGGVLAVYVEGAQEGATVSDSTDLSGSTEPIALGARDVGGTASGFFNGRMRDVRIINGNSAYTAAFTPAAAHALPRGAFGVHGTVKDVAGADAARRVMILRRDVCQVAAEAYSCDPDPYIEKVVTLVRGYRAAQGNAVAAGECFDSGPVRHAYTATGDATTGADGFPSPLFWPTSLDMDGSGGWSTPCHDFLLGSGDFTIEAWTGNPTGALCGVWNNTSRRSWGLYFDFAHRPTFSYSTSGTATTHSLQAGSGMPVDGYQHHACVQRTGGVIYLFVDGAEVASQAETGTLYAAPDSDLFEIGHSAGALASDFNGVGNDLRITKGQARYSTSGFTPPGALPDAYAEGLGSYTVYVNDNTEHIAIALDDATTDPIENDLCDRVIPA